MQNNLVYVLLGLFVVLMVGFYAANVYTRRKLAKERPIVRPDEVYVREFEHLDQAAFLSTWRQLSSVLEVPTDKLLPDDTISGLARHRHLPELYFEKIEIYLSEHGIAPAEVDVDTTVRQLIEKLVQHQTDYSRRP